MNFEVRKPLVIDCVLTEYCKQEGGFCQKE